MTKAAVRVRLVAPRGLHQPQGLARETSGGDDGAMRAGPVGVEVSHLTLVNQQIVALGESISLGIVDADKARALFFVDAPRRDERDGPQVAGPSAGAGPPARTCSSSWASRRKRPARIEARIDPTARAPRLPGRRGGGPDPKLLPFPPPAPRRQRM